MADTIKKEEMVTIIIDPKRTRGGITVNGKKYVGKVTVSATQADDLMRIQEDFAATIDKLTDPSVILRHQNLETIKRLFIADPSNDGQKPTFSREYGMLDTPRGAAAIHLKYVAQQDIDEWKQEREGMFNY